MFFGFHEQRVTASKGECYHCTVLYIMQAHLLSICGAYWGEISLDLSGSTNLWSEVPPQQYVSVVDLQWVPWGSWNPTFWSLMVRHCLPLQFPTLFPCFSMSILCLQDGRIFFCEYTRCDLRETYMYFLRGHDLISPPPHWLDSLVCTRTWKNILISHRTS